MSAPTLRPLARPSVPRPAAAGPGPLWAGLVAALTALAASLLAVAAPVLLVWATDPRSTAPFAAALRTAGQVWLLAGGAPLDLPQGRLSLVPLGLLLLPVGLLVRAAGRAAVAARVADTSGAARLVAAVVLPYAAGAGVVASLSGTPQARAGLLGAVVSAAAVALLAAGAGVLRATGLHRRAAARVPGRLRVLAAPATAALLVLLAAGALLVGGALAASAGQAADLARSSAPGPVGGVALLLLGLVLVPTAVVWGACWLAGPGVALGTGTAVSPFDVDLGAVPSLPLLAALPAGAPPLLLGLLALAVPVAAGAVAGLLVVRRGSAHPVVDAALCGPLAGLGVAALALLASGAAGGARLAELGPSAWRCGLAVALEVAVGAAAAAASAVALQARRSAVADGS